VEQAEQALPFELTFAAKPEDIRDALGQVRAVLRRSVGDEALAARAEQVLAEALNNVEEHAYAGGDAGPVRLSLSQQGNDLCAVIRDRGFAMPQGRPPNGRLPATDVAREDLPEGGFGWYLIRHLSDSLIYKRDEGENYLGLCFSARSDG